MIADISSASGIEFINNNYYVVGDDNPWLYTLDKDFKIIKKTQVSGIDSLNSGRTPKNIKPDFESIAKNSEDDQINAVILSSGSLSPARDTAHIINIDNHSSLISGNIRSLYDRIKVKAGMDMENEINIEGLLFNKDRAFLLQRGNISGNFIIEINKDSFISYITYNTEPPDFKLHKLQLPDFKGVQSGFSGGCLHPDGKGIIFTATLEDTNNEVDDGEIIGSFIGYIPFNKLNDGRFSTVLLMKDNVVLKDKIESICVSEYVQDVNTETLEIVTVSDNDDGTSGLIKFTLIIVED